MIRTKVLCITDHGEQLVQYEMPNGDIITELSELQGSIIASVIDEWNGYGKQAARMRTS